MPEVEFPNVPLNESNLLDKSLCLFGGSGSGKSTIIFHIMETLRHHIDQVIVFCPTDPMNKSYSGTWGDEKGGIVPRPLIHTQLTAEILNAIWQRQEVLASMYSRANDVGTITRLFRRLNLSKINAIIEKAEIEKAKAIQNVKESLEDGVTFSPKIEEIKKKYDDFILLVYKKQIIQNIEILAKHDLSLEERHTLKYLNFNPRMLIIFDDCSDQYQILSKEGKATLSKMFFQNRWVFLTVLLVAHDDKLLDAQIRKNAYMTICTSAQSAVSYFSRKSNAISPELIRQAAALSKQIYVEGSHQKLVYMRTNDSIGITVASKPKEIFVFGSEIIREYCRKIESSTTIMIDKSNPFTRYFDNTPL